MTSPLAWKKLELPTEIDSAILVAAAAFVLVWDERDERFDSRAYATAKRALDRIYFGRPESETDALIRASKFGEALRLAIFSACDRAFGSEPLP